MCAMIYLPNGVKGIMQTIQQEGGTPYLVGGAVRDTLLNEVPHDYDVASNLTPEEVIDVFKKHNINVVESLGNNFGVVCAFHQGSFVEVATFRADRYDGTDAHRPSSVTFSKTIEEDLARRDFTVNALAMDLNGKIIDPYGGQQDIQNRLLRPVGDAKTRYMEDALRMYRACRFVAKLRFTYSENGKDEAKEFCGDRDFWKSCNAKNLSSSRVLDETRKLILLNNADAGFRLMMTSGLINAPCLQRKNGKEVYVEPFKPLAHLYKLEQNTEHHIFDAWEHTLHALADSPSMNIMLRFAVLFHDSAKGLEGIRDVREDGQPTDYNHEKESAKILKKSLEELGFSHDNIRQACWIVRNHMDFINLQAVNNRQVERWVRRKAHDFGKQKDLVENLYLLNSMFRADMRASSFMSGVAYHRDISPRMDYAIQFAKDRMVLHSSELDISGNDVLKAIQGTDINIKDAFTNLIRKVQDGNVKNEEKALQKSLEKYVKRHTENLEVER